MTFRGSSGDVPGTSRASWVDALINQMEEDLRINLFSFADLRNEPNYEKIFHLFDQFYYSYGRVPGQNELLTAPAGNHQLVSSFVVSDNISPT